jgi:hypothetical protein
MNDLGPSQSLGNTFSSESWEYANAFADSLGRPPTSITYLVRTLLASEGQAPDVISRDCAMSLTRFLKSGAFRAPYFHAVSMLRPERLREERRPFLTNHFIEAFSPTEHAILAALMFMHRMAARKADASLIKATTERLQRTLNLGWFVGLALEPVGREVGMLVGGVRWLGLLPLVRHDRDGLRTYLKRLKRSDDAIADACYETEMWGCASVQIALLLLQRFGFSTQRINPLMRALTTTTTLLDSVEPIERAYRVAEIWIRYMLESRSSPSVPMQAAYYLGVDRINEIAECVLRGMGSPVFNWLSAGPGDLTPESAPQLVSGDTCEDPSLTPPTHDGESL